MGTSRKTPGLFGGRIDVHRNRDGEVTGKSVEQPSFLGGKHVETTHSDGSRSTTRQHVGFLDSDYLETIGPGGTKIRTYQKKDVFGNVYWESIDQSGRITRSREQRSVIDDPYIEHLGPHTPPVRDLKRNPLRSTRRSSRPGSASLEAQLLKYGVILFLIVVAIIAAFMSAPFWLGGAIVGWLTGFGMAALRVRHIGQDGLASAAAFPSSSKEGEWEIAPEFASRAFRFAPDGVVPCLASIVWVSLLAWPIFDVVREVQWAGFGAVVSSIAGIVTGVIWSKRGFRRGINLAVRRVQGLAGGKDAFWGGAGVAFAIVLLLLLSFGGASLPHTLRSKYGTGNNLSSNRR